MKYALLLERDPAVCNHTAAVLSSIGYLVTPVFNARKALHAAHMIQFDLIVTWTLTNPGDRRCLSGELKRCAPDALLILVADGEATLSAGSGMAGVNSVLCRPFTTQDVKKVVELGHHETVPPVLGGWNERRRRSID